MKLTNFSDPDVLREYAKTVISHPYVVYPAILREMGGISGKNVLDIGCGNGDFAKELIDREARCTGIDISQPAIDYCKKRFSGNINARFEEVGASNIMIANTTSAFDYAVANMVMINVEDIFTLQGIFRETARVLRQGGRFIFTDLHPLCKMIPKTATENQSYLEGFSYFKDGSDFVSEVMMTDQSRMTFVDKHWTLETYLDAINLAGMRLRKIIEPKTTASAPAEIFGDSPFPEYILFNCVRDQW